MDRDEYEGLVRQLEAESENSPAAFRTKVVLLSISAYVLLFVSLLVIVAITYWGIGYARSHHQTRLLITLSVFAFLMVPVFYVVIRMFFMRLSPPDGREISRLDAPILFEVLDKMRKKLNGPPIHHVLIFDEYNAAIEQLPRFGLFGGHTNYLMLGLPYLLGVATKEMLATVAHEYGHLCGDHGKMGAWIYRQRRTFLALYEKVEALAETSWPHEMMYALMRRFMPRYDAYTFVLSRQQEYEADNTASEIAGAQHRATGLVRGRLLAQWIAEDFWPKFYKQTEALAAPAFFPFASMRTAFSLGYADWATQPRLSAAWRESSGPSDTHPCLRARVEAVGGDARIPPPIEKTAAEALLGSFTKTLIEEFDRDWWKKEKAEWQSRHQYVARSKQELAAFSTQPIASLGLHELQQFALLKAEFDSPQAAKPMLEYLLAKSGGPYPKPAFFYGRILLDEGDERGLEHLETAARGDRNCIRSVADTGYRFLLEKRGERAADAWWEKIAVLSD